VARLQRHVHAGGLVAELLEGDAARRELVAPRGGRAQRALHHAERLGALLGGQQFAAVDPIGRHAGEQYVAAHLVEVADEGVELVDRADRLGGVAVLLQPARSARG
jgi:hypothetical protein